MNVLVTARPHHALSYWLPVNLVPAAHEACRNLPASPTTAHPAWNGLVVALGLATSRPRNHPLAQSNRVEVRLSAAEHLLLCNLTRLLPDLVTALKENP